MNANSVLLQALRLTMVFLVSAVIDRLRGLDAMAVSAVDDAIHKLPEVSGASCHGRSSCVCLSIYMYDDAARDCFILVRSTTIRHGIGLRLSLFPLVLQRLCAYFFK